MCDSDDPGDNAPGGLDLTGFLFGNIDESGQLEDDGLLDGESKRMLSSLTRLGLGSMLSEVLDEAEPSKDDEEKGLFDCTICPHLRSVVVVHHTCIVEKYIIDRL